MSRQLDFLRSRFGRVLVLVCLLIVPSLGQADENTEDHTSPSGREVVDKRFVGFFPLPEDKSQIAATLEKNAQKYVEVWKGLLELQNELDAALKDVSYSSRGYVCRKFYKETLEKKLLDRYETYFDLNATHILEDKVWDETSLQYLFSEKPPRLKKETESLQNQNRLGRYPDCGGRTLALIWWTVQHNFHRMVEDAKKKGINEENLSSLVVFLARGMGGSDADTTLADRAKKELGLATIPHEEVLLYEAWKASTSGQLDKARTLLWATAGGLHGTPLKEGGWRYSGLGDNRNGPSVPSELKLDPDEYLRELNAKYKDIDPSYFTAFLPWQVQGSPKKIHDELWTREQAFYGLMDKIHAAKSNKDEKAVKLIRALVPFCSRASPADGKITDQVIDELTDCLVTRFMEIISVSLKEARELASAEIQRSGGEKEATAGNDPVLSLAIKSIPPGILTLYERGMGRRSETVLLSRAALDAAKRLRALDKGAQKLVPDDLFYDLQLLAMERSPISGRISQVSDLGSARIKRINDWIAKIASDPNLTPHEVESLVLTGNLLRVDSTRTAGPITTEDMTHSSLRGKDPSNRAVSRPVERPRSPVVLPPVPYLSQMDRDHSRAWVEDEPKVNPEANQEQICKAVADYDREHPPGGQYNGSLYSHITKEYRDKAEVAKAYSQFYMNYHFASGEDKELVQISDAMKDRPVSDAEKLLKEPYAAILEKHYGQKWDAVVAGLDADKKNMYGLMLRVEGMLSKIKTIEADSYVATMNWCRVQTYMGQVYETIQAKLEDLSAIRVDTLGREGAEKALQEKFGDYLLAEVGEDLKDLLAKGTSIEEIKRRIAKKLLEQFLASWTPLEDRGDRFQVQGNLQLKNGTRLEKFGMPLGWTALVGRARAALGSGKSEGVFVYPREFRKPVQFLFEQAGVDTSLLDKFFRGTLTPAERSAFLLALEQAASSSAEGKLPHFDEAVGLVLALASEGQHNGLDQVANGENGRFRAEAAAKHSQTLLTRQVAEAPAVDYTQLRCGGEDMALSSFMKKENPELHAAFFGEDKEKLLRTYLGEPELNMEDWIAEQVRKAPKEYKAHTEAYFRTLQKKGILAEMLKQNTERFGEDDYALSTLFNELKRRGELPKEMTWDSIKGDAFKKLAPHAQQYARLGLLRKFLSETSQPSVSPVSPLPDAQGNGNNRATAVAKRVEELRLALNTTQQTLLALHSSEAIQAMFVGSYYPTPAAHEQAKERVRNELKTAYRNALEGFQQQYQGLLSGMNARDRMALPPDALLMADRYAKLLYAHHESERNLLRARAGKLEVSLRGPRTSTRDRDLAAKAALDKQWKEHEGKMPPLLAQQQFLRQAIERLKLLPAKDVGIAPLLAEKLQAYLDGGMDNLGLDHDELTSAILKIAMYCSKEENKKFCQGSSRFSDVGETLELLYVVGMRDFETVKPASYSAYYADTSGTVHPFGSGSQRYFSPCAAQIFLEELEQKKDRLIARFATPTQPETTVPTEPGSGPVTPPVQPVVEDPVVPVPVPAVAEKPKALTWGNTATFLGESGAPKGPGFLSSVAPFQKVPKDANSRVRNETLRTNRDLLAEALDLLADPKSNGEQIRKSFGAYHQAKFGAALPATLDRGTLLRLRVSLAADVWDEVEASGGTIENGRMESALGLLPPTARNQRSLRGLAAYLTPQPGQRASDLATRHDTVLNWARKALATEGIKDDPAMDIVAMLADSVDDYWVAKGHSNHGASLARLREENRLRALQPEVVERLEIVKKEAIKRGKVLTGLAQQWILSDPNVSHLVSDVSRFLIRPRTSTDPADPMRNPALVVDALTGEFTEIPGNLVRLHQDWGSFALSPFPLRKDFETDEAYEAAMRATVEENRRRLLAMVETLKKGRFTYEEIQRLLGDYLLRTRGFTPYQMVAVLDPRLNIHGGGGPRQALDRIVDKEHLDGIIAQLLMDTLDVSRIFRSPTPIVARPDLGGQSPETMALQKQFVPVMGDGGETTGVVSMMRSMVKFRQDLAADKKTVARELPFLDEFQQDRFARVMQVLRQLPGTHLPPDEEIEDLIVRNVMGTHVRKRTAVSWDTRTPENERPEPQDVPRDEQFPAVLADDVAELLRTVKGLHGIAYGDGKLDDLTQAVAPAWVAQAANSDHPQYVLRNKWLVRLLNENEKSSRFLKLLEAYEEPFVSVDEIEKMLEFIIPEDLRTQAMKDDVAVIANILRAARWVEEEWAKKGKDKVTDEDIARIVGHAIFGLAPDKPIPTDEMGPVAEKVKWVKLALHLLQTAPNPQERQSVIAKYLEENIHFDGMPNDDKLKAERNAYAINEFMRFVRMFAPPESSRAAFVAKEDRELQKQFLDAWFRGIQTDHRHLGAILPGSQFGSVVALAQSRDDLLRRISRVQRVLADDPPEIDLKPENTSTSIQIGMDGAGDFHRVDGMYKFMKKLIETEDPTLFEQLLDQPIPITIKDTSEHRGLGSSPLVNAGNEIYAPALATFRCRLLDAMKEVYNTSFERSDHHTSLVSWEIQQTPLQRSRSLKVLTKLVRDVEVMMMAPYSDSDAEVKAYRDQLRELDLVHYQRVLADRIVLSEKGIPGCSYVSREEPIPGGTGKRTRKTSRLAWNGLALRNWAWHPSTDDFRYAPSAVKNDGEFLSLLNGNTMDEWRGDRKYTHGTQTAWRHPDGSAFRTWATASQIYGRGYPHDSVRITPPSQDWAEGLLTGIKEPERTVLAGRLESAEKEAKKLDDQVIETHSPAKILGAEVWDGSRKDELDGSFKKLERAGHLREAIYRDIVAAYNREHTTPPTIIPTLSERRLLALPDHLRTLVALIVNRNREKSQRLRNISYHRGEWTEDEKQREAAALGVTDLSVFGDKAKLFALAKKIDDETNRLLLNPDLSTLISSGWGDPQVREKILEVAEYTGPWSHEQWKPVRDLAKSLRRIDALLLPSGEKILTLPEREELRNQFAAVFTLLNQESDQEKRFKRFGHEWEAEKVAEGRRVSKNYWAMVFRMVEEGQTLEFAKKNSDFAKAYEEVMGGDRRFSPEVVAAELKREREVAGACEPKEGQELPFACKKLAEHIERMHGLGRGVSTHARLRFLDAEDAEVLTEADFKQWERLENVVLANLITHNSGDDSKRLALELIRAVPHPAVLDQVSQKYDADRYLFSQLEEKTPQISEEIIRDLVELAKNGKVAVISLEKGPDGKMVAREAQRTCETVKGFSLAEAAEKGGEVIKDVVFDQAASEKIRPSLLKLAKVAAFKEALEKFRIESQRDPSFEEVQKIVEADDNKLLKAKLLEVSVFLRDQASRRYLEEVTRGERDVASLKLDDPKSPHGCAMRALLGPRSFQDTERLFKTFALEAVGLHINADGSLPAMTKDQLEKFNNEMAALINSPDLLDLMESNFQRAISHDKPDSLPELGQRERFSPESAVASNALRENMMACYAQWKKDGRAIPELARTDDSPVMDLVTLLLDEKGGARSLHQTAQIETKKYEAEADLHIGPTALDLRFFTDPETGRIKLTEKQIATFKKHLEKGSDDGVEKMVTNLEEDLDRYRNQANSLLEYQAKLRLYLEASMGSPIDGEITREEIQANKAIIARIKGLIGEEVKKRHEALDEKKRPPFPGFVDHAFLVSIENDAKLVQLVHDFNLAKTKAIQAKRDKYKMPEGFDPTTIVHELDRVKLRSLLRRGAALVRMERIEEIEKQLGTLAATEDQRIAKVVEGDFAKLAQECMALLNGQGKTGFKRDGEDFKREDVDQVAQQLMQYETMQANLRGLMRSLVPPAGVHVEGIRGPSDLFAKYVQNDPQYKAVVAQFQKDDSPVKLTPEEFAAIERQLVTDVHGEWQKESREIADGLEGLAQLGFRWDGAGLQWDAGDTKGLKLHLIGRSGIKIKSLADLKAKLEGLREFGIYRQNGMNPWRLLMDELWVEYGKAGFRPFFEFGQSAVCMAQFTNEDSSFGDGYHNLNGEPELLGRSLQGAMLDEVGQTAAVASGDLSDGNLQAARLCLGGQTRIKDGKRINIAQVPPSYETEDFEAMPEHFLSDYNNGEKYLSFMSLSEARKYAQQVHDQIRANMAGEGSDYHKAVMQVRGQSSNLWAGFDVTASDPVTGDWNGPWNGIASRLDAANKLLSAEHEKLSKGVKRLQALGAIQINVESDGGGVEQHAALVAESYRQQKRYIMDPEMFTHLPREVMENIDNQEQFIYEQIAWEVATLGMASVVHLGVMGLRAARFAQVAKYARWVERGEKALHLAHHMVKGARDAYRFGMGGKLFADIISNWEYNFGDRGYVVTQPLSPHHTHRSAMVFALLPVATPALQALAKIGGVPARLIPWVANPLAMGGTHYGVELAHGADPRHALIGSVPMFMFGLPAAKIIGNLGGRAMKTRIGGYLLRPAWVRNTLSYGANHAYFATVTGTGAVLQHYFTPEAFRDPETGEAVFRDPRTGKEVKDASILDIIRLSVIANVGMDAFFARNHVRETQAHAAGHLIQTGVPYRSVLEMFGGNNPRAQQNAHHLVMEGLATISAKQFRDMVEQRKDLERSLEQNPNNPKDRADLDRLNQTLSLIARSAGFGTGEFGVYEHDAVQEYTRRLEAYTKGKQGNYLLGELNSTLAREHVFERVAELKKKEGSGTVEEWAELMEDPAFQAGGPSMPSRLTVVPAEKIREGLRDPVHREKFEPFVQTLASLVNIPQEAMGSFAEFLASYKPAKGENPFRIAMKFKTMHLRLQASVANPGSASPLSRGWNRTRQIWRNRGEHVEDTVLAVGAKRFPELVGEGQMTLEEFAQFSKSAPEVLGEVRLADVHVLQRLAAGEGEAAKEAQELLNLIAGRYGVTPELFGAAVERISKGEPGTPGNASFGKTSGKLLSHFDAQFVPEAARTLSENVASGEKPLSELLEYPFFNEAENLEFVPAKGFELGGEGAEKQADPRHVEYVRWAAGDYLDAHPKFKRLLTERGVSYKDFQEYVIGYLRAKGGEHANLAEVIVAAQAKFEPQVAPKKIIGAMDIAQFESLHTQWKDIVARLERNPDDAEAKADWQKIAPDLSALVEYSGFKDAKGDLDYRMLFTYLQKAREIRNRRREPGSPAEQDFPVRELLHDAVRLAQADLAAKVRDGSMDIQDLVHHDLFVSRWDSKVATGEPKYSTEAASQIPQDLLVKAFRDAPDGARKVELAQAIVAVSEAIGYTEAKLGVPFLSFVTLYRGEGKTVAELARLFRKGSSREIGDLIVSGHLDFDVVQTLPELPLADLKRSIARRTWRDPANSRAEEIVRDLRVKDILSLLEQSKDENHPNQANAVKTLALVSQLVGANPKVFETFVSAYAKGVDDPSLTGRLAGFFGFGSSRQDRTLKGIAPEFWRTNKDVVKTALAADPRLVDTMIESGFFEGGEHYSYLPSQSLILSQRRQKVVDAQGEREALLFARASHITLVETAAGEAFKDPVFSKHISDKGIAGETAVKEFTQFLKDKMIENPGKHPDLESYIEATKSEYLESKGITTGSWRPVWGLEPLAMAC